MEKDANKAQTSMQVRSGQSVVIGGLRAAGDLLRQRRAALAPARCPLLDFFDRKAAGTERKQDVLVFVTPYVWIPAVDPPFPLPDAFKFREGDELTAIEQWKRRWIKP